MVSYPSAQEERDAARAALQADVAAFLASGGTITEIPAGVTSEPLESRGTK
jgi:hypothetical protein